VTIPVKKSQEALYNLDPGSFFENRFWARQLDRVAINEDMQIAYILKCKWSTHRDVGFLEVKEAGANEHHKSIISALKDAVQKWEFQQIDFVVDNRGLVLESDFYIKLKKLDVQEGKNGKLFEKDSITSASSKATRLFLTK